METAEHETARAAGYHDEARRLSASADPADRRRAVQCRALADATGESAAAMRRDAAACLEPVRIQGDYGATAYVTHSWTFEVIDLDAVPRCFLGLNSETIRAAIANDGVRDIPGLRIFQSEHLRIRGGGVMPDGTGALSSSRRDPHTRRAPPAYLMPHSIAAVRELAELIAAGEWAPASYRRADGQYVVEKIVLGIMHGAAVGLGPFAAVHAIAVIDGQPTIWGDGALALVERSGLVEDMREDYTLDDEEGLTAICTMRRRPWPTPVTRRFSMAMAEAAGLTQKEGPWQTYPKRMLMMRARAWALRDGFADVLRGLSIREEVDDYDSTVTALAEPAFAGSPDRSASRFRHPVARPRFADYLASRAPAARSRPQIGTDCRNGGVVADPRRSSAWAAKAGIGSRLLTAAKASTPPAGLAPPDAESLALREHHHTGEEGPEPAAANPDTDAGLPNATLASAAYALIDAEGRVIDLDSLDELRAAFDRLFADLHLSAAQVLGLWESNKVARDEIERGFGAAVLAEAEHRRQSAEGETKERGSARRRKANRSIAATRSGRGIRQYNGLAADARHQLKLDPASSDEELLQLYRSRLLRLKRRRAKAVTFIDFRQANHASEARLRKHLPDRIAEIDALYHWAAVHAD